MKTLPFVWCPVSHIKITFGAGTDILNACEYAVNAAKIHACNVCFDFNEITLTVDARTIPAAAANLWRTEFAELTRKEERE